MNTKIQILNSIDLENISGGMENYSLVKRPQHQSVPVA